MPYHQDYEQDYGDDQEKETVSTTREKPPGVYVRNNDYPPHELDMLWSGSRHFTKDDRSPVVFTVIGIIVGSIITGAIFFLFTSKPQVSTDESELTQPITQEAELVPKVADPTAPPPPKTVAKEPATTPATSSVTVKKIFSPKAVPATHPTTRPTARTRTKRGSVRGGTYVVRSGDTLERIAQKYYGSGTPSMIEKIRRANKMRNPNQLQIGQKLVIPPKSY